MKLLAIETATTACSVALWIDGEVHEHLEPAARRQTETVMPMVETLMAQAGLSLGQLDGLAFSHGPGAFTGVRVGTSVIQGLALAADLPVSGVSTLAACAWMGAGQLGDNRPLLAAFDARMGEIYLGGYQRSAGGLEQLMADCLCSPEELPAIPELAWTGVGSGGVYAEPLGQRLALADWYHDVIPQARAVAALAAPALSRGEGVPAEQAMPVYLRNRVTQG
jgi:tRNA threonylcarbamoyladenosine biosynthesis protein TsaB